MYQFDVTYMTEMQKNTMDSYRFINLDVLKEISEGSHDLMRDLITMFISQVPTFSEQLDNYYRTNDFISLGKLAHKIKGSVAMMGINELTSDMKKLELLALEKKDTHKYPEFISKFKQISGEAIVELKTILQTM